MSVVEKCALGLVLLFLAVACATLLPWMASPLVTTAPLAATRMSRSVWDRPLPSWVQKGWMVLPVKS